jgi:hypothetical protein
MHQHASAVADISHSVRKVPKKRVPPALCAIPMQNSRQKHHLAFKWPEWSAMNRPDIGQELEKIRVLHSI